MYFLELHGIIFFWISFFSTCKDTDLRVNLHRFIENGKRLTIIKNNGMAAKFIPCEIFLDRLMIVHPELIQVRREFSGSLQLILVNDITYFLEEWITSLLIFILVVI